MTFLYCVFLVGCAVLLIGGITEQRIPLIINRRTEVPASARLRNFDIFDLALNRLS